MTFWGFKKIIFSCIPILLFVCCADRYATIETQVLTVDKVRRTDDTVMYDSLQHFAFSRLRRPASFGMGFEYKLPEKNRGKEIYVVVSGRTRSNYAQSSAVIVVVAHKAQEQLSWQVIPMRLYYAEPNTWCTFKDSVRLPAQFDWKIYDRITTVAHLSNSTKENFDLDTLNVVVKQKQ